MIEIRGIQYNFTEEEIYQLSDKLNVLRNRLERKSKKKLNNKQFIAQITKEDKEKLKIETDQYVNYYVPLFKKNIMDDFLIYQLKNTIQ